MHDILTITLNPAVDLSTTAETVSAGPKLRCTPPKTDPGGGGINVSRAIRILGGQSRALVAVGGPTGKKLRHLLLAEGIATLPFRAPGETRQSLAVTDETTGAQYRFVLPGPDWDKERHDALLDMLPGVVPDEGFVVLSGSLPPGIPADFPTTLAKTLAPRKPRIIADLSGAALETTVTAPPANLHTLRMDWHEAETLNAAPLPTLQDTADFAAALIASGTAQVVIIARGGEGSVLASRHEILHAAAARVPVASKVGAGDSFVGAYTLSLARGEDLGVALQRGTAAASAAVMTPATELCRASDAERLLADCPLTSLNATPT